MATVSTVTRARVRLATNTPGGPVNNAVRRTIQQAAVTATANAPVGNPGDYLHRLYFPSWARGPATPGTFKASFRTDLKGTRGSNVVGNLRNTADHAWYVERGRRTRGGFQMFASAGRPPLSLGGSAFEEQEALQEALVRTVGTATRRGTYVMADALADAAAAVLGVRAGRAAVTSAASSSAINPSALR